jgi:hypothetical protein
LFVLSAASLGRLRRLTLIGCTLLLLAALAHAATLPHAYARAGIGVL